MEISLDTKRDVYNACIVVSGPALAAAKSHWEIESLLMDQFQEARQEFLDLWSLTQRGKNEALQVREPIPGEETA